MRFCPSFPYHSSSSSSLLKRFRLLLFIIVLLFLVYLFATSPKYPTIAWVGEPRRGCPRGWGWGEGRYKNLKLHTMSLTRKEVSAVAGGGVILGSPSLGSSHVNVRRWECSKCSVTALSNFAFKTLWRN